MWSVGCPASRQRLRMVRMLGAEPELSVASLWHALHGSFQAVLGSKGRQIAATWLSMPRRCAVRIADHTDWSVQSYVGIYWKIGPFQKNSFDPVFISIFLPTRYLISIYIIVFWWSLGCFVVDFLPPHGWRFFTSQFIVFPRHLLIWKTGSWPRLHMLHVLQSEKMIRVWTRFQGFQVTPVVVFLIKKSGGEGKSKSKVGWNRRKRKTSGDISGQY